MCYCVQLDSTMGLSYTLVFCLALAVVQGRTDWEVVKKYWDKCVEETGAEETMDDVYIKEITPTSDKGMCLVECLMRAKSFYDLDGKYNEEGAKKYFAVLFEEKPENIEKALAVAEKCSKIDIEGLDKCEAAVKHVTCAKAKFSERNIEPVRD